MDIFIGLKMNSIKMKITYIIALAFGLNFYLEFFKKRNFYNILSVLITYFV